MSEDLKSRVDQYYWFHSIDLGKGIVTPGSKTPATHALESSAYFDRVELSGRSVLDVGAWNGFYSFDAKRRGAARVLATDSYCWTNSDFRGLETFELARAALGLDVEARMIDVGELSAETVGEFDVVLFLGVFYHRYDPIDALARAARLARELLIVESHLDLRDLDRPAMAFYPGSELADDATNWWGPNERLLEALLRGHGFQEIEIAPHPLGPGRGVVHAWRSLSLRRAPLPAESRLQPPRVSIRRRLRALFRS